MGKKSGSILFYMLIAVVLICTVITFAQNLRERNVMIEGTGAITSLNVELYTNSTELEYMTNHNWGVLDPGENASFQVWVKNSGNVPLDMFLTTYEWNPEKLVNYTSVTWDHENYIVPPKEGFLATITMSIYPNIPEDIIDFNYNMYVTGVDDSDF